MENDGQASEDGLRTSEAALQVPRELSGRAYIFSTLSYDQCDVVLLFVRIKLANLIDDRRNQSLWRQSAMSPNRFD